MLEAIVQVGVGLASLVTVVISGLVARNQGNTDRKLDRIEGKLDDVDAKVGAHAAQLAGGAVKFEEHERRLNGLEDRERENLRRAG